MAEGKQESIGALWRKTSKDGAAYFSGKITINGETVRVVIFPNSFKDKDSKPDMIIYEGKSNEEQHPF